MDTLELIKLSQEGNKEARDRVVTENVGLVWSIVRRFANRGHEMEDLFQIGSIGLIKAVDKFDSSYEVKFSTYAVPMITGEIKRFLRDDGMIKVSRSLKETATKIRNVREKFVSSFGREPTLEEIKAELDITNEEFVMALDTGVEVESLYKTIYQGDGNLSGSGIKDGKKDIKNYERKNESIITFYSSIVKYYYHIIIILIKASAKN